MIKKLTKVRVLQSLKRWKHILKVARRSFNDDEFVPCEKIMNVYDNEHPEIAMETHCCSLCTLYNDYAEDRCRGCPLVALGDGCLDGTNLNFSSWEKAYYADDWEGIIDGAQGMVNNLTIVYNDIERFKPKK